MGFAWTSADVYYFTAFEGPPPQPVTGIQAAPLPRPAPHEGPRRRPAARHRRPARGPRARSLITAPRLLAPAYAQHRH
jgi:hypothetical protein